MSQNTHHQTPPFPAPAEQTKRTVLFPLDQAEQNASEAESANIPLSAKAKPGSVTASVLEAIEQSGMPVPVSRDARVKRPPRAAASLP